MPVSLLDQLKRSAMLTAQIGMATRAQYSRHVPSNSTTVHILATGLQIDKYNHSMQGLFPPSYLYTNQDSYEKLLQAIAHELHF